MSDERRRAFVTGVLFVITFVASIPAVILYDPLLKDPNYVLEVGADWRMHLGALLEFITGIANIGTAVVLFPLLKRESETLALSYVASRIVESTLIAVGIVCVLGVVTLRVSAAGSPGADAGALLVSARALVAMHDWTFVLGPGLLAGFGNGLLLGTLLYRSRLVPRPFALLGVVGGPLIFASGIASLFGLYPQLSPLAFIFGMPEIVWEASLGIWLTVRGFSPSSPLLQSAATN
jgi:hypothetical protein